MPKKNKADLLAAFSMEPKDAVAFFRAKGFRITDQWQEMDGAAHAKAFTVAKAMRMDILEDIREATDAAISEGITEREFVNRLAPALKKKGWWGKETWMDAQGNEREVQLGSVHRLKTIFRANTSTAYMAGRYRRQLALVDDRPYWMYQAILDSRTRPSHAALHGKVFRWDDPIWQFIYPPNGWGCRCSVRNLSERNLQREGLTVESGADYIQMVTRETGANMQTGEVMTVNHPVVTLPDGRTMSPDLGWGHNPGASAFGTDASIAEKLGQISNSEVRAQVIRDLNSSDLRSDSFARWVDQVAAGETTGQGRAAAGLLPDALANAVLRLTGSAPGRLMALSEGEILRRAQVQGGITALEFWRAIPQLLHRPQAVLWDSADHALVYVAGAAQQSTVSVIRAPYPLASTSAAPLASNLQPVVVRITELADRARYELLEGTLEGLL